jgi:hypothetical protein
LRCISARWIVRSQAPPSNWTRLMSGRSNPANRSAILEDRQPPPLQNVGERFGCWPEPPVADTPRPSRSASRRSRHVRPVRRRQACGTRCRARFRSDVRTLRKPGRRLGALPATAHVLREQSIALKGATALLSMNQPPGFDCPGCAWPDPKHTSSFEFCENGAKAVSFELTRRQVTRAFFAAHSVEELAQHSDYWLEEQGRLPNRCGTIRYRHGPQRADQLE